jgi:hypothetical protein
MSVALSLGDVASRLPQPAQAIAQAMLAASRGKA